MMATGSKAVEYATLKGSFIWPTVSFQHFLFLVILGGSCVSNLAVAADSNGWIDLTKLIDPARDAVAGTWSRTSEGVKCDESPFARLEFPTAPPDEYDLTVVFSSEKIKGGVTIILVQHGHQFFFRLGTNKNTLAGIADVDGKNVPDNVTRSEFSIDANKRYRVQLQVRNSGIRVNVDYKTVVDYKTNGNDLSLRKEWKLRDSRLLGIGTHNTPVTFHKVELRQWNQPAIVTRTESPALKPTQSSSDRGTDSPSTRPKTGWIPRLTETEKYLDIGVIVFGALVVAIALYLFVLRDHLPRLRREGVIAIGKAKSFVIAVARRSYDVAQIVARGVKVVASLCNFAKRSKHDSLSSAILGAAPTSNSTAVDNTARSDQEFSNIKIERVNKTCLVLFVLFQITFFGSVLLEVIILAGLNIDFGEHPFALFLVIAFELLCVFGFIFPFFYMPLNWFAILRCRRRALGLFGGFGLMALWVIQLINLGCSTTYYQWSMKFYQKVEVRFEIPH